MQCSFLSKIIGVISNWNTSSNWKAFFRSVSVPVRGGGLYQIFKNTKKFSTKKNFKNSYFIEQLRPTSDGCNQLIRN
jgi:hypothetical protein